ERDEAHRVAPAGELPRDQGLLDLGSADVAHVRQAGQRAISAWSDEAHGRPGPEIDRAGHDAESRIITDTGARPGSRGIDGSQVAPSRPNLLEEQRSTLQRAVADQEIEAVANDREPAPLVLAHVAQEIVGRDAVGDRGFDDLAA